MKTARTNIDVYVGTLSMEISDITIHFNILDAMKHPSEDLYVFCVEIIDHVVDEYMIDLHSNLHDMYLIKLYHVKLVLSFK